MVGRPQSYAPYAPSKNVLEVIRRKRERGLPEFVDGQVLQQIGIPLGNVSRTARALQFLGLIGEDGRQTTELDRLGRASVEEYPERLAEMIRNAYQPIFTLVDPARDAESAVKDAFRQYEPGAQRDRMVTLFISLCHEAGLATDQGPKSDRSRTKRPRPSRSITQPLDLVPTAKAKETNASASADFARETVDFSLISAFMQQLPSNGKWTKSKRERWLQALTAAVDLLVETAE